jgi:hypothetical protein
MDFHNAVVLLEPGEKEEGLVRDVALERPQQRQGRVIDPNGRPLTGVTVYGLVQFGIDTLKGDEFTVKEVNPRASRPLVFHHKDRDLGFYLKDLRDAAPGPLTIKLQSCGSISGRIVDHEGRPVADMAVHVMGNALRVIGEAGGGYHRATTDKDGRFHVKGLVPGQTYAVQEMGYRPSFPRFFTEVVVKTGEHKDVGDIKMVQEK